MIKVCRLFDLIKHISTTKLNKIVVFRHATKIFSVPVRHLFKFSKNSMMTKYEWVNKDQSDDEEVEEAAAGGGTGPRSCSCRLTTRWSWSAEGETIAHNNFWPGLYLSLIAVDENIRFGQTEKCNCRFLQ